MDREVADIVAATLKFQVNDALVEACYYMNVCHWHSQILGISITTDISKALSGYRPHNRPTPAGRKNGQFRRARDGLTSK